MVFHAFQLKVQYHYSRVYGILILITVFDSGYKTILNPTNFDLSTFNDQIIDTANGHFKADKLDFSVKVSNWPKIDSYELNASVADQVFNRV